MGLVPPRYVLSHALLTDIAWLNGRNFLAQTRARPLTDRAYADRISAPNAGRLERFLDRATLTVTPFGVSPIGGLVS